MSSVVKWSCLLALAVLLFDAGPAVGSAVPRAPVAAGAIGSRRNDPPCATATEGPATCLFKGLLKNALLYATRRRQAHDTGGAGTALRPKGIEDYLFDQIQNLIGLFSFGFELPAEVTAPWTMLKSSLFNGRGKKNKNMGPMLAAGAAMIVGTLMPLAFGALFMLAGKAIMTSMLAITISGMLGLKTMFGKSESVQAVKSLSAPAHPLHYNSEALYEQESTAYRNNKGQTEAKVTDSGTDFFAGESNTNVHRGYYNDPKQTQQSRGDGPNRPQWDVANSAKSISNDGDFNKITAEKNDGAF
ncbi:Protein of unknown function DUF1676 [Cinara cedri]|uniref:Uncharacterized protein n=1 Tax=Cinara cedri TaxID=506608 RepID=A0A5E4MSU0_9HEMI|nr:Protein of unknown function DUF1676 [Cinara cedri]